MLKHRSRMRFGGDSGLTAGRWRSWMLADTRGHLRRHSRRLAAIKTPRRSKNVRARTIVEKAWTVLEVHGRFAEARGLNWKLPRTPAVCIRQSRNCAGKSRIPRVERVKLGYSLQGRHWTRPKGPSVIVAIIEGWRFGWRDARGSRKIVKKGILACLPSTFLIILKMSTPQVQ